jgi:hypothetical protein
MTKKILITIAIVAFIATIFSVLPNKGLELYCNTEAGETEFAIIDPLGRYLGYEPSTNIRVTTVRHMVGQIPDAYYSCFSTGAVDAKNNLIHPSKNFWIQKPILGFYSLKIFGISNSEHYRVYLNNDNVILEGFVKRGQVIKYYLITFPTPFDVIQFAMKTETANFIISTIIITLIIIAIFVSVKKRKLCRYTGPTDVEGPPAQ